MKSQGALISFISCGSHERPSPASCTFARDEILAARMEMCVFSIGPAGLGSELVVIIDNADIHDPVYSGQASEMKALFTSHEFQ